jgi:hypothetical protein
MAMTGATAAAIPGVESFIFKSAKLEVALRISDAVAAMQGGSIPSRTRVFLSSGSLEEEPGECAQDALEKS